MSIEWKKEYNLNIKKIDEQHKKFFEILSKADDILLLQKHEKEQEDILKEMFEYADYHFSTEENYFQQFNYPLKDKHIEEHDKYRQKVLDFYAKISNENYIYEEMIDFIGNWWIGHILHTDKKYVDFFNKHNIK